MAHESWGLDFVTSLCVIDREQFEVTKSSVNTMKNHLAWRNSTENFLFFAEQELVSCPSLNLS